MVGFGVRVEDSGVGSRIGVRVGSRVGCQGLGKILGLDRVLRSRAEIGFRSQMMVVFRLSRFKSWILNQMLGSESTIVYGRSRVLDREGWNPIQKLHHEFSNQESGLHSRLDLEIVTQFKS